MPGYFLQKHLLPRLKRWTGQGGWLLPVRALDGGIDPPDAKQISLTHAPAVMPSDALALPSELVIPLQQHQGEVSHPVVQPGDYVHKNQLIAGAVGPRGLNQHAPTSGHIVSISRPIPSSGHAAGLQRSWQQRVHQSSPAIVIRPDGLHLSRDNTEPGVSDWTTASAQTLLQCVIDAGICGLGGAGFPSAYKLSARGIHTVIVNGAECEPYITADETLMQHRADDIVAGAGIIRAITGAQRCIIAIEDNKTAAIRAMQTALAAASEPPDLMLIPSLYPSGSEKQLVRITTGLEVPSGKHPTDVGVLCHSVATAKAVADAVIRHQPLIARMTTVTGPGVPTPQNIEALIGTPISTLLAFAGCTPDQTTQILIGGPLMGYPAASVDIPLAKTFNCLLVDVIPQAADKQHRDCIRCDFCADACPVKLQPQTLYFHARHHQHEAAQAFGLFDCIECGACTAVCPSKIPLVSYYREEKAAIRAEASAQTQSLHWRQAYEHNRNRLQTLAVEQEQRRLEKLQHKLHALDNGETLSRLTPAVNITTASAEPEPDSSQDTSSTPAAVVSQTAAAPMAAKTPEQIRADIEAAVARTRARKAALQQAPRDAGDDAGNRGNAGKDGNT